MFDVGADVLERFLRYVQIDTQADEDSPTSPSTAKQLDLLRLLEVELRAIGLTEVELDANGYLFGTVPSTQPASGPDASDVPVIGFLAHVDTSPEVTGANVKPQIVRGYAGGDIVLPGDSSQVIRVDENPELANCLGHDIVTSDGTALLGADNKAGVAEVVTAARYLIEHPEIAHGKIRVGFTPDEEIGRGTAHFDLERFGAQYAYTLDGSTAGEIEDETFNADQVRVTFVGRAVHPGFAKGKLVNSIKLAAEFIAKLPRDGCSPETTADREGYVHPYVIEGGVERTTVRVLLRDFDLDGLRQSEELLRRLAEEVAQSAPRARLEFEVRETYRNMRYVLDQHPRTVELALEAVRRVGLTPRRSAIRGGTDGAMLTAKGLPTPNIFAGEHNFHSQREWVSVQDMVKSIEVIVELAKLWAEGR
ncbi:MAG: peptidase T [Chloroflexi bacterium]|nr:peptidase T [Chloroflexota bacterium]